MKRFIPKLEKTDGDYKLWGLSIPKLPHGHHIPHIIKRNSAVIKEDPIRRKAVVEKCSPIVCENNKVEKLEPAVENGDAQKASGEAEPFADIVFSFFSSTDQHYVVHSSNNNHLPDGPAGDGDYETMKVSQIGGDKADQDRKMHKSELTFYVSAASLKGSRSSVADYDRPGRSSRSSSIFITQHKSLNDLTDDVGSVKYQNSASLDNLSRVCNISLHNAGSKRSIASLPDLDTAKRQRKDRFQSQPNQVGAKASIKSDTSARAQRIRNRISAIYTSHKVAKGRKRFSKAWHGIKEWFELERARIDKVIHKKNTMKVTTRSSDDYPESEFSEYEDIEEPSYTRGRSSEVSDFERKGPRSRSVCNSVYKLNVAKDNAKNGTLRQSISQPSVLIISEPVLVKINCESVDDCLAESLRFGDADRAVVPAREIRENSESTTASSHLRQESGGFAELKGAVKEGSAACKELYTILQQRADAERQYASAISRIGVRARRGSKGFATMSTTSKRIAVDLEIRTQLHKQFSNQMVEEIIRPLQRLVSTRDVMRKQIERDVEITARRLSELRTSEARMKKLSHSAARFNERIQDANLTNGLTPSQEIELRKKKVKSDEAATKSDVEYYTACLRAERARVEWETTIKKSSELLINLEDERLEIMRHILKKYVVIATALGPGVISDEATRLENNFDQTLDEEKQQMRQLIQPPHAMHLPDFYCQHITLAMNKERRKEALLRILQLIRTDMERERKSKQALEKLSHAMNTTPNFGANDSQQNVSEKLYHMRSVLTYLEGARIQAAGALSVLLGRERTPHPLSPHLKVMRDRRGLQNTTLTIPPWLQFEYKGTVQSIEEDRATSSPPSYPNSPALTSRSSDRGAADGVSMQHYSDIDENCNEDVPERPPPPKFDLVNQGNLYDISAM